MARVQVQQRNARVAVPVQCEFIETAHGQVARARVVVISHHVRLPGDEEGVERTSIRWTVWGRLAETVARTLVVGSHCNVVGHMQSTRYQDREGREVFGFDFTVEQIDFLERREVAESRRVQRSRANEGRTQAQAAATTTDMTA